MKKNIHLHITQIPTRIDTVHFMRNKLANKHANMSNYDKSYAPCRDRTCDPRVISTKL